MTGVTAINGSSALPLPPVSAAPSDSPVKPQSVTDQATASADAVSAASADVVGGSRTLSDPLAKVVITQYLDNSGDQVVFQSPPSTVVAYLQNGLTVNGYPQKSTTA